MSKIGAHVLDNELDSELWIENENLVAIATDDDEDYQQFEDWDTDIPARI